MKLKLLKFSAGWCGPCKMQKEELAKNPIGIDIQEIDIDSTAPEDMESVQKYKIMSIPNMVIIDHNDTVQARFIGYTPVIKSKRLLPRYRKTAREGL